MASSDHDPVSASKDPLVGRTVQHTHHRHAGPHPHNSFHHHVTAAQHPPATPAAAQDVTEALHTAMAKEGVPNSWEQGLQFIMGHESRGHVGVTNTTDSARGLFQLTSASYHLNPSGERSFGNAVEEAQGGIRYIQGRYQSADHAMAFWRRHGWY